MSKQVKFILVGLFLFWALSGITQGTLYVPKTNFDYPKAVLIDSLLQTANELRFKDIEECQTISKKALDLSLQNKDKRQEGFARLFIALTEMSSGEWESAKLYFEQSIAAFQLQKDSVHLGLAYDKLGYAHRQLGETAKALDLHLKGLELRKKYGDSAINIAYSQASVGGMYRYIGDYETALPYLEAAYKIRRQEKDSVGMAHSLNGLARLYSKTNEVDKALASFQQALNLYIYQENHQFQFTTKVNISDNLIKKKEFATAEKYLQEAIQVAKEKDMVGRIGEVYQRMGDLLALQQNHETANSYFALAIKSFKESGAIESLKNTYLAASKSLAATKDYRLAYDLLSNYQSIQDSIYQVNTMLEFAKQSTLFKTKEKENENQLLRQRQLWLTIGGTLLSFMFFLLILAFRSRQKSYRELVQQKNRVENLLKEKEHLLVNLKETQEHLLQSEKMASIGQLTAGIAHEINNPINFIASGINALKVNLADINKVLTQLNSLKKSPLEADINQLIELHNQLEISFLQKENIQITSSIIKGVKRTENIITGLRNFARKGDQQFHLSNIEMGLHSTLILVKHKLGKNIKLVKSFEPIPKVNCQIDRLNQVFLNLISNAIEAMENGGILTIKTYQDQPNSVKIEISDTGIGMDENTRSHLFEPFFTTKEIGKGTGLGLAISYSIILDHKGKIEVKSTVGKGSTFTVEIPVGVG